MKAEYDLTVVDTAVVAALGEESFRVYRREEGDKILYKVTLSIDGRDLPYVASATYRFQHASAAQTRTSPRTVANPNCALTIWTQGTLWVEVTIGLKSGQNIVKTHELGYGKEIESIAEHALSYVSVPPGTSPKRPMRADPWSNTVSFARAAVAGGAVMVAIMSLVSWLTLLDSPTANRQLVPGEGVQALPPRVGAFGTADVFRDCPQCPELTRIPAGVVDMSASVDERESDGAEGGHRVVFEMPLAVGVHEVTRGEFAAFVEAEGYDVGETSCGILIENDWETVRGGGWEQPGFDQENGHPVICVSWWDAESYVQWLTRKTGRNYRLLSESEWEYVAKAGTRYRRYWADGGGEPCDYANASDRSGTCSDGNRYTAPVGSYKPNEFGLYDVLGNVWEWTADCWHESYEGAPADGRAWEEEHAGDCTQRVVRGGSWLNPVRYLDATLRNQVGNSYRDSTVGFRVARELEPGE